MSCPGGTRLRIERPRNSEVAWGRRASEDASELCERDATQPRMDLGVSISREIRHFRCCCESAAKNICVKIWKSDVTVRHRVIGEEIVYPCMQRRSAYLQCLATYAPVYQQSIERRTVGARMVDENPCSMHEACWHRLIVEDPTDLSSINERVIVRLHVGLAVVLDCGVDEQLCRSASELRSE